MRPISPSFRCGEVLRITASAITGSDYIAQFLCYFADISIVIGRHFKREYPYFIRKLLKWLEVVT